MRERGKGRSQSRSLQDFQLQRFSFSLRKQVILQNLTPSVNQSSCPFHRSGIGFLRRGITIILVISSLEAVWEGCRLPAVDPRIPSRATIFWSQVSGTNISNVEMEQPRVFDLISTVDTFMC